MLWEFRSQILQKNCCLIVGAEGSYHQKGNVQTQQSAENVKAIDTTAAGDTFIGYYLSGILKGKSIQESLKIATRASAICVTRPGAMDSIPSNEEVL